MYGGQLEQYLIHKSKINEENTMYINKRVYKRFKKASRLEI